MVCVDRSTFRFRVGVTHCGGMRRPAGIGRRPKVYDSAMRQTAITIFVASCLLLSACDSSGSNSEASTTTTTVAPAPTAVATTTTETAVPTTEAPSTTIDTEAQFAAAEQAYVDAFDAYIAATRDPSNPDLRAEIDRLYTGPSLESAISQLDGFVRQNWVARPAEEPSMATVLVSPQFLPDRTDIVELVACAINTERIVEVGAAPDGSDALVDDEVTVVRGLIRLELIDGQWKAQSGETLATLAPPEDCEP